MIKKNYTGSARRARNIIWNAAGRYDFDPPFMAFFANGHPDQYFNMVVGFVQKWLDLPRLWDFFLSYEGDRRADELDDLLWLGLENCVYEKELKERPILESLRRERGKLFFVEQQQMSVQQMEYQSMPVYNQQEYRWASVCGRRTPLLSAREKRMAQALLFSGELDTDGVIAVMQAFAAFINDEGLNDKQIVFVHRVIDHIEKCGYMEPEALAQPPFDRPQSFARLFDRKRQMLLVKIIKGIKENALRPAA